MVRPRRAAAQKPQGHYAASTSPTKRRKTSSTASSARKKGKKRAEAQYEEDSMGLPVPTLAPPPAPATQPIPVIAPQPLDPTALALDLNTSYEGRIPQSTPRLPSRQPRWRQPATNPILFKEHTPKGWNDKEPDLHPDDLDAQIARCRERIDDNILTRVFEFKLQDLLKEKRRRDEMIALAPAGLSWAVVQRLESLQSTLEWLQSENDKYELVGNVTNIIAAYRSGQLRWNQGLVTYWSRGAQLCQPRPFRWAEFDIINAEHAGHTGFWVEGLEGPAPGLQMAEWVSMPFLGQGMYCAYMDIEVRLPQWNMHPTATYQPIMPSMPNTISFLDDTGASTMQINESDVQKLIAFNCDTQRNPPPPPPLLGSMHVKIADGTTISRICRRFEVNMWDSHARDYLDLVWNPIQVLIHDDTNTPWTIPLNGPWPRHRMYTASAPDGTRFTYFSDQHPQSLNVPTASPHQMTSWLPDLPVNQVPQAKTAAPAGPAAGGAVP